MIKQASHGDTLEAYKWSFLQVQLWQWTHENETGLCIETYQTDYGELKSEDISNWLTNKGITHEYTAPHPSAHIGCMHRMLMSKSRTTHIYTDLLPFLWCKLHLTASYPHAKMITCSLNGKAPWKLLYRWKPDYSSQKKIIPNLGIWFGKGMDI